jgi:hypothetical protein
MELAVLKAAVGQVQQEYAISQRRACGLMTMAVSSYRYMAEVLRYCKHPLRRGKLASRFGISHPPISRYCKPLRGILVRTMQINTKSTHGRIVRS